MLSTQAGGKPGSNNSANVQTGSDNTALISQKDGNNNQGTFQAGHANAVVTTQVSRLADGKNNSGNVQDGDYNSAVTTQTNSAPNPQATGVAYSNNAFSSQFGSGNSTYVTQKGGQNNQAAVQGGIGNMSVVTQTDKAITPGFAAVVGGANSAFTAQFGDNNTINTTQKTKDATSELRRRLRQYVGGDAIRHRQLRHDRPEGLG